MALPRVYDIAKELGIDTNEALAKLKDLGEYVKSGSSTIAPPVAKKLRDAFPNSKPKAEEPKAAPAAPAPAAAPAAPAAPTPNSPPSSKTLSSANPRNTTSATTTSPTAR